MEKLSIGKMAKLNGTTPRALRFYAEKGLLEPRYVDPDSGFRYYDIRQCFDLDRIQELQSLGCTLEQIAAVMQAPDNIDALLRCVEEQGYEVAGDYFDEILGETPAPDGGRVMFFKMYIPIVRRR